MKKYLTIHVYNEHSQNIIKKIYKLEKSILL